MTGPGVEPGQEQTQDVQLNNLQIDRQQQSPEPWIGAREMAELGLAPALLEWLTFGGLLTPRLRQARCSPVTLEVLRQEPILGGPEGHDLLREVALSCDGLRLVYALSWFPASVMRCNPWLHSLQAKPLGDALFQHGDVSRSAFEFRPTSAGDPRYERAIQGYPERPATLWARRSYFSLEGGRALVEEVFLPSVYRSPGCQD